MTQTISNPILNGPFEQPDRHFTIGPHGLTGEIKDGRRASESLIPIAMTRKGRRGQDDTEQVELDFDATGERRERNNLINDIRRDVEKWRRGGQYAGVTPISRKLQHWADPDRGERVLFCPREAAETAIFLTEVAGRTHSYADWRKRLEPENEVHNAGLPRIALKMATGSGKTIVMAMLIAWQSLNKVQSPRHARFANRFLTVTPGITIMDRLRVLLPEAPDNYYAKFDLIPADLKGGLEHARVVITNYHAFQLKDAKEIRGVAKNTRLLLKAALAMVLQKFFNRHKHRSITFVHGKRVAERKGMSQKDMASLIDPTLTAALEKQHELDNQLDQVMPDREEFAAPTDEDAQ